MFSPSSGLLHRDSERNAGNDIAISRQTKEGSHAPPPSSTLPVQITFLRFPGSGFDLNFGLHGPVNEPN